MCLNLLTECDYGGYSQSYFLMLKICIVSTYCFGNQNKTIKIRSFHKRKHNKFTSLFHCIYCIITQSKILATTTARALGELAPL